MAAYGKWKQKQIEKNYNVAMLVNQFPKVAEFEFLEGRADKELRWGKELRQGKESRWRKELKREKEIRWGRNVRSGDFIAVRYRGSRQYQHIGALFADANKNGVLDGGDIVIHAGPAPLHFSYLREGNFDGHVVTLRP
jgi:hypothetical protein